MAPLALTDDLRWEQETSRAAASCFPAFSQLSVRCVWMSSTPQQLLQDGGKRRQRHHRASRRGGDGEERCEELRSFLLLPGERQSVRERGPQQHPVLPQTAGLQRCSHLHYRHCHGRKHAELCNTVTTFRWYSICNRRSKTKQQKVPRNRKFTVKRRYANIPIHGASSLNCCFTVIVRPITLRQEEKKILSAKSVTVKTPINFKINK